MATALEICQGMEKIIKKDNPIYLSFYHYCKHYLSPAQQVDLKAIDSYFRRVYAFDFWRKENLHLQRQIQKLLGQLLSKESLREIVKSNFLHQCQLITLTQKRDWLAVVNTYAQTKKTPYSLIEADGQALYVHYQTEENRHVIQRMYPHCYISAGKLHPITTDEILYFDENIQLIPFQTQHLHLNDHTYLRFEASIKKIQARTFKGYSMHPSSMMSLASIEDNSKVYYAVKRFESLITGKNDNGMYQRLCDLLEKSLDLLKVDHPEAVKLAFVALERGKNAQQTTFPNDKLLQVLIKELSFHLNRKVEGTRAHVDSFE